MPDRITVIGAGNVGATLAQRLVERDYADIVLLDIIEGLPQGKALDILESTPVIGFDNRITGTNDYRDTASSQVVIITSGIGRKPGMTRDQLLLTNMDIVAGVTREVIQYSPDCIIITVTNPVDAMTTLALKTSGLPRHRVCGLSGVLDTARLRTFIAEELDVSPASVTACILGEHGQNMVVIPRLCTVAGTPITSLLPPERVEGLVKRAIGGGAEIVGLLKTGSAFYAPSAAAAQMAEVIILDKKCTLPCSAYLDGEYGISGIAITVPVKLGRRGIEEIIELELTEAEKAALNKAAAAIRQQVAAMKLD